MTIVSGTTSRNSAMSLAILLLKWKNIAKWMQGHVERFEKRFGTIPQRPKGAKEEPPTGLAV